LTLPASSTCTVTYNKGWRAATLITLCPLTGGCLDCCGAEETHSGQNMDRLIYIKCSDQYCKTYTVVDSYRSSFSQKGRCWQ
jgi:hypothetical protein